MIYDFLELDNISKSNYLNDFYFNSVLKINKIIDKNICSKALSYFIKNEEYLISKYKNDSKGLVLDKINEKDYIKYFEYPLSENFGIFGPFINNKIFDLASKLLDCHVFLRSMEIHTRGPGSTDIPPHQDNGYYGLKNSDALTFYIALNPQNSEDGGLTYISNKQGNEFEHISSSSKAFSLCINPNDLPKTNKHFEPNYDTGDCTIHHACSIHFAEPVRFSANNRSVVVRLTFFGENNVIKEGHLDWYKKMLKANRDQ